MGLWSALINYQTDTCSAQHLGVSKQQVRALYHSRKMGRKAGEPLKVTKSILRQRGAIKTGWHWRRILFSILISQVLRKYKEHLHLHSWSTKYHFLLKQRGARGSSVSSCWSCHSVLPNIIFSNRFQYSTVGAFTVTFGILMLRQTFVFFLFPLCMKK